MEQSRAKIITWRRVVMLVAMMGVLVTNFIWLPSLLVDDSDVSPRFRRLGHERQLIDTDTGPWMQIALSDDKTEFTEQIRVKKDNDMKDNAESLAEKVICKRELTNCTGANVDKDEVDLTWKINGACVDATTIVQQLKDITADTKLAIIATFASEKQMDADLIAYVRDLPLDARGKRDFKSKLQSAGITRRGHLASANALALTEGVDNPLLQNTITEEINNQKLARQDGQDGQVAPSIAAAAAIRAQAEEKVRNIKAELISMASASLDATEGRVRERAARLDGLLSSLQHEIDEIDNNAGKNAIGQLDTTAGAKVTGEKLSTRQLLSRTGVFHGVRIEADNIEPMTPGKPVALALAYQNMKDASLENKVRFHSPMQAFQTTVESSSSSQMQKASMIINTLGISASSSVLIETGFGIDFGFLSIGASSQHMETESSSEEQERIEVARLNRMSHRYFKKRITFEPTALISITNDMLEPSEEFKTMVASDEDEDKLAKQIIETFGTHSCTRVTVGGIYTVKASYTSKKEKTEADLSARTTRAVEKISGDVAAVEAAGQNDKAAVSVGGGGGEVNIHRKVDGSGFRSIDSFVDKEDSLDITEEWVGGKSATGLVKFRDSLAEAFSGNWHIIDRHVDHCSGNWKLIHKTSLREKVRHRWLDGMQVHQDDRRGTEDVDISEIFEKKCSNFVCPTGYWPKAGSASVFGYNTQTCCQQRATLSNSRYGSGWTFVNEKGRSVLDITDLSATAPRSYHLPTYGITAPFNQVLVQRLSKTWCDSWGRKTQYWVEPGGASMGVQADEDYWYTHNNHRSPHSDAGSHTWLRQSANYLQPGVCKECWGHPGNGNEYNPDATIESLEQDGSVVKISFPTDKTMLKVGNLDAFYNQAGGCDAPHDVIYRVYVRSMEMEPGVTLSRYGGGWVFLNEPGRSTHDINDLTVIQPRTTYHLPVYIVPMSFNQVLVERVSPNWCDSWGRKTQYWVESNGASMGVQADEDYWYTFNNHRGRHTWLRQSTKYLPPGLCRECWGHPGNGNEETPLEGKNINNGVIIESLEDDGSVVKITFPEVKNMLKIGNLDSFYHQAGGCDASGPVSYRVFARMRV